MKVKALIMAVMLPMIAVSCNVDDTASLQGTQIGVVVGVVQTRAGYSGTEVLPSEFVIDIVQGEDPKYDYENVMMTLVAGTNRYESELDMLWAGNSRSGLTVKAMTIPYGLTSVDAVNPMYVSVALDQSDAEAVKASDFLVCSSKVDGDVSVSGNNLNMRFRHFMTKLEISYVFGAGLSAQDVTFNNVSLKGVCVEGGYSFAKMAIDYTLYLNEGDVSMYVDEASGCFEALFFPHIPSQNPKLILDLTIAGEQRVLACEITPKSAAGFESGKKYTMTVTIASNSVNPSSIGISSGWDAGTDAGTGTGSNDVTLETE